MTQPDGGYTRSFRTLTLVASIATFALVVIGGVVRVTGSGLGCPDWPLCYGQLLPPAQIESIIEFSHRFVAAIVSLMVVAIGIIAWRSHRADRRVALPAFAAVGFLIVQIVLGAITVVLELPPTVVALHLGTALVLFACLLIVTTNVWQTPVRLADSRVSSLAIVLTLAIFGVIVLGSLVTASSASLACLDWPLCQGQIVPALRDPFVAIHVTHRFAVFASGILLLALAVEAWRIRMQSPRTWRIVLVLLFVFGAQVTVGALAVLLRLPIAVRALHLGIAALVWATSIVLVTRLMSAGSKSLLRRDMRMAQNAKAG